MGTLGPARAQPGLSRLAVQIPGQKIRCIFGFCDIRGFEVSIPCSTARDLARHNIPCGMILRQSANEALEKDVFPFVNKIADYVHQARQHVAT